VLCRACNAIIEPGKAHCALHPPDSPGALAPEGTRIRKAIFPSTLDPELPTLPLFLGSPDVYGNREGPALTINSTIRTHRIMVSSESVPEPDKGLTTIQLTKATRDRIFRLKFRKTYDEFLREICDRYETEEADARK